MKTLAIVAATFVGGAIFGVLIGALNQGTAFYVGYYLGAILGL